MNILCPICNAPFKMENVTTEWGIRRKEYLFEFTHQSSPNQSNHYLKFKISRGFKDFIAEHSFYYEPAPSEMDSSYSYFFHNDWSINVEGQHFNFKNPIRHSPGNDKQPIPFPATEHNIQNWVNDTVKQYQSIRQRVDKLAHFQ